MSDVVRAEHKRPSCVFFGLPSSVELFEDRTFPEAITRAKEAALLYDNVLFEIGLLDVTVGPHGGMSMWHPPDALTPEFRERARRPIQLGAPMTIAIGQEATPGVPATHMRPVVQTEISRAYVAEFHTGILDELVPLGYEWVDAISVPTTLPLGDPVGDVIRRQNNADRSDRELLEHLGRFERDLVYQSFNRDAAVAARIDAAFTITPLFEPMTARRGIRIDRAGDEALAIAVPNLGTARWEAIAEFRDHAACRDARDILRGFEERAIESEPDDAIAYVRNVAQQVTDAFAQAYLEERSNLAAELGKEAIKTSVSFIPGVGPLVETVATATQLGLSEARRRRSWTSALMKLREAAER
ncbi:MAG: hypothetical protein M3N47_14940 [Chloroflexota bacterium]|nr:hypothetical protein [Chloroflexota bacterium]